jgi:hypothetical protein
MLRNLVLFTAPLLLAAGAAHAQASCVYPQAPQTFPNGASATKEEMLTAQQAVKAYSKEVQDVYLGCLEKEKNDAIAALDPADAEGYEQKKKAIEEIHAKKHNAAVDELSAIASRWSEEIKAFNLKGKE